MTSLDLLNPDFRDLLRSLCEEHVEFLVVGAYAVAYHGHHRTPSRHLRPQKIVNRLIDSRWFSLSGPRRSIHWFR